GLHRIPQHQTRIGAPAGTDQMVRDREAMRIGTVAELPDQALADLQVCPFTALPVRYRIQQFARRRVLEAETPVTAPFQQRGSRRFLEQRFQGLRLAAEQIRERQRIELLAEKRRQRERAPAGLGDRMELALQYRGQVLRQSNIVSARSDAK